MFHYDTVHWITFFGAALLLNLSPGPDMAFILGQTVKGGRAKGFAAMLGIWLGAACHALIAAFGLSAIFMTSASAFLVLKWVGAGYLVWLGFQAIKSNGSAWLSSDTTHSMAAISAQKIFQQGVIVSLLNPKVALFFMAFLPQFVVVGAGPASAQLLLHGLLIILIAGIVEPPMILVADRMARQFRHSRRMGLWLDRSLGCLLIGLGIKLATSEQ